MPTSKTKEDWSWTWGRHDPVCRENLKAFTRLKESGVLLLPLLIAFPRSLIPLLDSFLLLAEDLTSLWISQNHNTIGQTGAPIPRMCSFGGLASCSKLWRKDFWKLHYPDSKEKTMQEQKFQLQKVPPHWQQKNLGGKESPKLTEWHEETISATEVGKSLPQLKRKPVPGCSVRVLWGWILLLSHTDITCLFALFTFVSLWFM